MEISQINEEREKKERALAMTVAGDLRHDLRNKIGLIDTYLKIVMERPKNPGMNEAVRLFQQRFKPLSPEEFDRIKRAHPQYYRLKIYMHDIFEHIKSVRYADAVTLNALKETMPVKIQMLQDQLARVAKDLKEKLEHAEIKPEEREYYQYLVDNELQGGQLNEVMDIIRAADPSEASRPFDLSELVKRFHHPPRTYVESDAPIIINGKPNTLFGHIDQLLTNAKQHQREGMRHEQTIRAKVVDGVAHVEVKDNGKGIPQENLERIFDEKFTTREEGTGLGLSKFRKFVEELGGHTWAESKPGHWTKICLRLPLHQSEK